jgi:tRNA nucleotidyltransferase/poly(A) polymerase
MDEAKQARQEILLKEAKDMYGENCVTPYSMSLPDGVDGVLKDLSSVGNPLIVGGAVRDSFDGYPSKDVDIEVHGASMDDIVSHLQSNGYQVDEVGRQFGVLKVSKGQLRDLDVSVPRRENRTGAGHRSFSVEMDEAMTVDEAAARRDFTFNTVMYDHSYGVLVDPTGGYSDYRNKTMRAVSEKFAEDPLRVLRGFQFAARFGMSYDKSTADMCRSIRGEYNDLSVERVREEFNKFYTKGSDYSAGVKALQDSGWDDIEPGLRESLQKQTTVDSLNRMKDAGVSAQKRSVIGSAVILKGMDNSKDRQNFAGVSTVSQDDARRAVTLAELSSDDMDSDYFIRKTAIVLAKRKTSFRDVRLLARTCDDKDMLKAANRAIRLGVGDKPTEDLVRGDDILNMTDRKPGRWFGRVLSEVREAQYKDQVTTRQQALDLTRELVSKQEHE